MLAIRAILMVFAWGLFAGLLWQLTSVLRAMWAAAGQMHRIPCSRCRFFTDNYRLKCTVHPEQANSTRAIGCYDFADVSPGVNS